MESLKANKKQIVTILIAFLAGALWLVAIRFVAYSPESVHYHANFAVFIDGERLALDSPLMYEEVQSCGGDDLNNPKIRVHMHDQIDHVVHVHDEASTWGHFFANIGMTDGDTIFRHDSEVFMEDESTKIGFVLNGDKVDTTANRTIRSEDTLLVSIGNPSQEDLDSQYSEITQDADEYNKRADPSACTGSKEPSFSERLKAAIGLTE